MYFKFSNIVGLVKITFKNNYRETRLNSMLIITYDTLL